MATQERTKRRNLFLAVLLALIAAGMLCVFGAAAAGYKFSSPLLDSIAAFFSGDRATTGGGGGAGGGGGGAVIPPTGGDGSGGGGGDGGDEDGGGDTDGGSGGGGGTANENCLLGLICLNAQIDANIDGSTDGGEGDSADANSITSATTQSNTDCFLGLICVTSNNMVNTGGVLDSNTVLDANVGDNGVDVDADSNADVDSGGAGDNNCLLGLICLNANLDATSKASQDATLASTLNVWWQDLLNLFAHVKLKADPGFRTEKAAVTPAAFFHLYQSCADPSDDRRISDAFAEVGTGANWI